ncbi:hypothetical protein Syun_007375 [Stephania yunnanensis]|uniref:Uncharacterized protein n=1 Tax=Stephania yunnanensis TaxID=152371 RepID=A0AAP0Q083_9MAGN
MCIASLRRTLSASLYPLCSSSILDLIPSSIRSTLDRPLNYARNYLPHLLPLASVVSSTSSTTMSSPPPPLSVLQSSSPPQSTATPISTPTSPPPSVGRGRPGPVHLLKFSGPSPPCLPSQSTKTCLHSPSLAPNLQPASLSLVSAFSSSLISRAKVVSTPLVALPLTLSSVVFWGSLVSASSTTHYGPCFGIGTVWPLSGSLVYDDLIVATVLRVDDLESELMRGPPPSQISSPLRCWAEVYLLTNRVPHFDRKEGPLDGQLLEQRGVVSPEVKKSELRSHSQVTTHVFYFQNFLLCPISSSLLSSLASIDWKSFGLNVKSSAIDEDGDAVLEWEILPPLDARHEVSGSRRLVEP